MFTKVNVTPRDEKKGKETDSFRRQERFENLFFERQPLPPFLSLYFLPPSLSLSLTHSTNLVNNNNDGVFTGIIVRYYIVIATQQYAILQSRG